MEDYLRTSLANMLKFMSYRPKYWVIRIALVSIIGILITHLAVNIFEVVDVSSKMKRFYPLIVCSFIFMSEGNLLIIQILNRYERTRWNLLVLPFGMVVISYILLMIIRAVTQYFLLDPTLINHGVFRLMHAFIVIFVFILYFVIIIILLAGRWIDSQKEIDQLKNAKLQSDYNSLQDQLNPHFLFNNLSVLKSLIRYDAKGAETFIENFTDVYRYVLKSRDHITVSVAKEMEFTNAYIGLQSERLGEGLVIDIQLSSIIMKCNVPPMAIQALVDNAIKHNQISRKRPLRISISNTENSIVVKNTLAPKKTTYSTQTGMKTLRMQYQLLGAGEVLVSESELEYSVTIPAI